MTPNETGPEIPSDQDMVAFAKEYIKSYMDAVEEKKPQTYPKFAQEGPYEINSILLPNGCICMVFNSSKEAKVHGFTKDWDEVQEMIVKGVDHFAGFYPFEGRSLGDWSKRGKRDALKDLRLLDKSDLIRSGAELEGIVESITKMVKANPWLGKTGSEMVTTLRGVEGRVKGGFPTVDAIAGLQALKVYNPGAESVTIEFPDRELLEDIADGIRDMGEFETKIEAVENRMFELEKSPKVPDLTQRVGEFAERVERLEKQLEKVSNILTMLNSKVESYFSKTAEKERQADMERKIEEYVARSLDHDKKIAKMEEETEKMVQEMKVLADKVDKDVHDSRKRIARIEKHYMDFSKLLQE